MRSTIFALLTGASTLALLTGGVQAQGVVNSPFIPGDTYTGGGNAPKGVDLTGINVPGVGVLAPNTTGVVEDLNGTPILATQSGVLNPNGTPIKTSYGAEATASSYVAPVVDPANVGGTYAAGDYVINASGQLVTPAQEAACTSTTCTFVKPTDTDPLKSYKWVEATYVNDPNYSTSNTLAGGLNGTNSTGTYTTGDVALTSTGAIATNLAQCTASAKCTFAAATSTDPALTASTNYTVKAVMTQPQGQGYGKVSINQGGHTSTTSFAGGAVYANDSGQTNAVGAGGVTVADKTGSSSTMTAGQIALTGATAGYGITLDANADPIITVTNGTAAGTTTIHNGDVSAGSSMTVGTGSNKTTISGGNIATSGTVSASSVVATTGSFDTLSTTGFSDVGATLTSYGSRLNADDTAIKMLNGQVANAQNTANKAFATAAIGAALPTLHWAPGDWLAVAAGGADAGAQGAWGLSAGALVTPRLAVSIKGGQSGNTGVVAGQVSYSFGGGNYPLK